MPADRLVRLRLGQRDRSWLSWSTSRRCDGLVLFVHGFRGSERATWGKIPQLLIEQSCFEMMDIGAVDYDSKRRQVQTHANALRGLLGTYHEDRDELCRCTGVTPDILGHRVPDPPTLLVAHSMGAVIARRALLDAAALGAGWVDNARLLLFAPAHVGARTDVLLSKTIPSLFRPVEALVRTLYPCLDELEPGCGTLNAIREDTSPLLSAGAKWPMADVWIAEVEQVVHTSRFLHDRPSSTVPESDHFSVCKATSRGEKSLDILESWITKSA